MSHRNGAGVRKAKAFLECLRGRMCSREVLSGAAILHPSPHPFEKKDEFIFQSHRGVMVVAWERRVHLGKSLTKLGACSILQKMSEKRCDCQL